jgi:hypothetical protein
MTAEWIGRRLRERATIRSHALGGLPVTKVFSAGRAAGKTEAMLKWMADQPDDEGPRVLVSLDGRESMRLLDLARGRGMAVESWQFVSVDELGRQGPSLWAGVRDRHRISLGIDNADMALSRLFRWPVAALSVTDEDPERVRDR